MSSVDAGIICVTQHVIWEESDCFWVTPGGFTPSRRYRALQSAWQCAVGGWPPEVRRQKVHVCAVLSMYVRVGLHPAITWGSLQLLPPPTTTVLPLTPRLPLPICADEFNPFVPKLEKSVSGSSSSRDRLLLTVTMLLLAAVFIS